MNDFNAVYCGDPLNKKYLQQHKAAAPGLKTIFFFWSPTKHALTDGFTVAIWTIKYKK